MKLNEIVDHCAYQHRKLGPVWVVGRHPHDGAAIIAVFHNPETDEEEFPLCVREDFIELLTDDKFKPTHGFAEEHWKAKRNACRHAPHKYDEFYKHLDAARDSLLAAIKLANEHCLPKTMRELVDAVNSVGRITSNVLTKIEAAQIAEAMEKGAAARGMSIESYERMVRLGQCAAPDKVTTNITAGAATRLPTIAEIEAAAAPLIERRTKSFEAHKLAMLPYQLGILHLTPPAAAVCINTTEMRECKPDDNGPSTCEPSPPAGDGQ